MSSVSPNSHHFQWAASLPADLKTGQRRSNTGKVRGKGGLRGSTCLCLLHPRFSRETDWRSISLPVRGKAFSQEGSDIINPLWFFPCPSLSLSPTFYVSLSPYCSCGVENNPIHNFPQVALWISPSHRITGVTFTRSLFISVKRSKPAWTSGPVQPHWTASTDTSLSSNTATYLQWFCHVILLSTMCKYRFMGPLLRNTIDVHIPIRLFHTLSLVFLYIFFSHQKQRRTDH